MPAPQPASPQPPQTSRRPGRARARLRTVPLAVARQLLAPRSRVGQPRRILIAHNLLFGDVICLTPLLAKARAAFPAAEIVMLVPPALMPLFSGRPFDVVAVAYAPHRVDDAMRASRSGFDLALVPGENRYCILARALGSRWTVAFAGDRPAYKNWMADELIEWPAYPWNWSDTTAGLLPGPAPPAFDRTQWPAPDHAGFRRPEREYAVLHIGARNPLRMWQPDKWRVVAEHLAARGIAPVFSGSAAEQSAIAAVDPDSRHPSYAGRLDIAQLFHLLRGARLLVSTDTGVPHLARATGTPNVVLFGPGSPILSGAGEFWRRVPSRAVWIEDFPCRDQNLIFKREIGGMRRCVRFAPACRDNRCMHAVTVRMATDAIDELLAMELTPG